MFVRITVLMNSHMSCHKHVGLITFTYDNDSVGLSWGDCSWNKCIPVKKLTVCFIFLNLVWHNIAYPVCGRFGLFLYSSQNNWILLQGIKFASAGQNMTMSIHSNIVIVSWEDMVYTAVYQALNDNDYILTAHVFLLYSHSCYKSLLWEGNEFLWSDWQWQPVLKKC